MHNDPSRTTPLGMIRYAHEFMEAALAVDEKMGKRPGFKNVAPIPALYLVGHSIELSLKAFLLSQGVTLRQIKTLGHDLHACEKKQKSSDFYGMCSLVARKRGHSKFSIVFTHPSNSST